MPSKLRIQITYCAEWPGEATRLVGQAV